MKRTIPYVIILMVFAGVISCSTENTPVYTLTTTSSPSEAGDITPESGNYDEGDVVSLQATPNEGWEFVRWEQDLSTSANPVNITMNQDYNVVGVFEKSTYSLNLSVEGEGSVEQRAIQQKSTDYPHGTVVELTAIPDEGWEFEEWSGDISSTENPYTITMTSEKTVTIVFEKAWPRDTETEVVEVTNPATGQTWMDRNLGASRAATSMDDEEAYGDLYQWGRAADGHQDRTSGTTSTLSSTDTPGHGDFILAPNSPFDWRSPQNDNLWQGGNGINNPCPDGYRLPTEAEWEAERQSWSSNNRVGAFESPLKLPVAGGRDENTGLLFAVVGSIGYYWSSSVPGPTSLLLYIDSSFVDIFSVGRALGFSVRCLKD